MDLIGRSSELESLEKSYQKPTGQLTIIYGRRRIGKSRLIKTFCIKKQHYYLEGIEGLDTQGQIHSAFQQLENQIGTRLYKGIEFTNWQAFLHYLTDKIVRVPGRKKIIVFDELQWLAVKRTKLISIIKYFWDNHWKEQGVDLILCGSIASYMINSVVKSRALYGRANQIVHLEGLLPFEVRKFLPNRSIDEVIKYQLILGAVPKYLEEINPRISFEKNINNLMFTKSGILKDEYERIFYSQFPEYKLYQNLIIALSQGAKSHLELSKFIKIPSGGGLSRYLNILEEAAFIEKSLKFKFAARNSIDKYFLADAYVSFYLKYIRPNLNLINKNINKDIFARVVKPVWAPWLGLAFESFCRKHAVLIAERLNFANHVIDFGQIIQKDKNALQIDLAYLRSDNVVTICEIKYHDSEIDTGLIPELERKKALLKLPRKYSLKTALISLRGPTKSLERSAYLNYSLVAEDLFR